MPPLRVERSMACQVCGGLERLSSRANDNGPRNSTDFQTVAGHDEALPVDYDTVEELLASEQKDRDSTKEAALDAQRQRGTPTRKFLQVWAGETNN
ncbi:hypothetical protein GGG16DRAFT_107415 [Schizophyllum commune]